MKSSTYVFASGIKPPRLTQLCFLASILQCAFLGIVLLLPVALQPSAWVHQNVKPLPQVLQQDWPQFRCNLQLTGVSLSTLPATLKLLWTYETGDSIESSAAIVDGTVYVGSQSGELVALSIPKGAVRWKYRTNEGIGESSPCVGQGVVYVGDLSGTLHAVNAMTVRDSGFSRRTAKSSPLQFWLTTGFWLGPTMSIFIVCPPAMGLCFGSFQSTARFTARRG